MAYIVDLTLVMQNIFWLVAIFRVPVSRRLVKLAYVAYKESIVRSDVHEGIKQHVQGQGVLDRLHRDSALDKIVELLHENRIDTAEMFGLKDEMGAVNFSAKDDESWIIKVRD
jgi:metallophosphoesterase superfamily enzyme